MESGVWWEVIQWWVVASGSSGGWTALIKARRDVGIKQRCGGLNPKKDGLKSSAIEMKLWH